VLVEPQPSIQPSQHEVGRGGAVERGEGRHVLPGGEDGRAVGGAERVGGEGERRRGGGALVAIVAHAANRLLAQQVGVAVRIQIAEPKPLPHVQPAILVRLPDEAPVGFLEKRDTVCALLHEQIVVAVVVNIYELRSRATQAAQERKLVGAARAVVHRKGRDLPLEGLGAERRGDPPSGQQNKRDGGQTSLNHEHENKSEETQTLVSNVADEHFLRSGVR
jgi:hypothetical protein